MTVEIRGMAPLLQVFDMPTAIRFYRDTLGFSVAASTGEGDDVDWVMLRFGDAILMLNTAYEAEHRPSAPDPLRIAAHQDTGIFFDCPDIDAAYAHLRAQGVAAQAPHVAPYGMKQLYVKDPDGYELCFQWRVA